MRGGVRRSGRGAAAAADGDRRRDVVPAADEPRATAHREHESDAGSARSMALSPPAPVAPSVFFWFLPLQCALGERPKRPLNRRWFPSNRRRLLDSAGMAVCPCLCLNPCPSLCPCPAAPSPLLCSRVPVSSVPPAVNRCLPSILQPPALARPRLFQPLVTAFAEAQETAVQPLSPRVSLKSGVGG